MEKVGAYTDRATELGEWRSGNPAAGQTATPMLSAWFNMLQRELLGLLEAANIPPDVGDDKQLAKSVWAMLRSATAAATETLRGVLRVGTQAEVNAGVLDNVAVTPKKLRAGVAYSIGQNGYVALPTWLGGLIIQWGQVSAPGPSTLINFSYPLAFTTTTYALYACLGLSTYVPASTPFVGIQSIVDKVSARIQMGYSASGTPVYWLAIGK